MAKKQEGKKQEGKEERLLNIWMPIGVMFGIVAAMVFSFNIGFGAVGGLLVGTMIGYILADDTHKTQSKKKKNKK